MKVLVIGGWAGSLLLFRGHLLRALRCSGHQVITAASGADNEVCQRLSTEGIRYFPLPLERAGMNPLSDWRAARAIRDLIGREKPDIVLAYTHKPIVYSALGARVRLGATRVYALVTGLGFAFIEGKGLKKWIARRILTTLYRRAAGSFAGVLFQNPDDQRVFEERGLLRPGTRQVVVRGSGIDLEEFTVCPVRSEGPVKFLLVARLLAEKGIREWVSAARLIRKDHPGCEFHLVGALDPNPSAIALGEVQGWVREGLIIFHGEQARVRSFFEDCTVYVLPSYREGTPRTVLEAMATGRAVITTDAPGCRETVFDAAMRDGSGVREGRNGFLVPVRSVDGLVSAMKRFIVDRERAVRMGAEGRALAEAYYDVRKVNRAILDFLGIEVRKVEKVELREGSCVREWSPC